MDSIDLARVLRILGDSLRLRILGVLMERRPEAVTVKELQCKVNAPQSTISVNLARMHQAGLVERERGYQGYRVSSSERLRVIDLALQDMINHRDAS